MPCNVLLFKMLDKCEQHLMAFVCVHVCVCQCARVLIGTGNYTTFVSDSYEAMNSKPQLSSGLDCSQIAPSFSQPPYSEWNNSFDPASSEAFCTGFPRFHRNSWLFFSRFRVTAVQIISWCSLHWQETRMSFQQRNVHLEGCSSNLMNLFGFSCCVEESTMKCTGRDCLKLEYVWCLCYLEKGRTALHIPREVSVGRVDVTK